MIVSICPEGPVADWVVPPEAATPEVVVVDAAVVVVVVVVVVVGPCWSWGAVPPDEQLVPISTTRATKHPALRRRTAMVTSNLSSVWGGAVGHEGAGRLDIRGRA